MGACRDALYDFAGETIAKLVRAEVPQNGQRILDVGAGWGKYRWLLPEYEMDAVEVWAPYVKRHRLDAYYAQVFVTDIATFNYPSRCYAAVIMGDVLEHVPVVGAQRAIREACLRAQRVYVASPFLMPQGEEEGNPHEVHVQDDLCEEVMRERYPELELYAQAVEGDHTKAVYVKRCA